MRADRKKETDPSHLPIYATSDPHQHGYRAKLLCGEISTLALGIA
jgi:hypothetical protein